MSENVSLKKLHLDWDANIKKELGKKWEEWGVFQAERDLPYKKKTIRSQHLLIDE